MTSSHEPSYYEIALTNRQVIVAFVILLLCLVAAFFSGVWIGRESGVRTAEQMVRAAPPPRPEERKEGQNLEELQFFESAQPKGAPAETPAAAASEATPAPTPGPAQGTTLAEDLGAEASGGTGGGAEATPAQPAREGQGRRVRFPEGSPGATQPAAEAAPSQRAEPAPRAPAAASGRMVIQVFSSPEKEQADRIRDRLVKGGQRAYLSPVEVAGRTMYRVRIGPFDSRDKAQQVAEQVRKGFKLDTWVTEE